jgi:hypothetical protein
MIQFRRSASSHLRDEETAPGNRDSVAAVSAPAIFGNPHDVAMGTNGLRSATHRLRVASAKSGGTVVCWFTRSADFKSSSWSVFIRSTPPMAPA